MKFRKKPERMIADHCDEFSSVKLGNGVYACGLMRKVNEVAPK